MFRMFCLILYIFYKGRQPFHPHSRWIWGWEPFRHFLCLQGRGPCQRRKEIHLQNMDVLFFLMYFLQGEYSKHLQGQWCFSWCFSSSDVCFGIHFVCPTLFLRKDGMFWSWSLLRRSVLQVGLLVKLQRFMKILSDRGMRWNRMDELKYHTLETSHTLTWNPKSWRFGSDDFLLQFWWFLGSMFGSFFGRGYTSHGDRVDDSLLWKFLSRWWFQTLFTFTR